MKRQAMHHTKMDMLMRSLGVPRYAAVGILESLWHLTAREAPCGNIGKLSNMRIAIGIEWRGAANRTREQEADRLVHSLTEAGWLDSDTYHRLTVHDWHEHADDSVKKYLKRNGLDITVSGHVATNRDMARLPVPEPVPIPAPAPLRMVRIGAPLRASEFAELYPEHSNDNLTVQHYLSLVEPSEEDLVFACLERYRTSDAVARGIFQTGSNWLKAQKANGWRGQWPEPPKSKSAQRAEEYARERELEEAEGKLHGYR